MLFIQCIFVLFCVYYVESSSFHKRYQYDEGSKMWLKLHRVKASWHEARNICDMEGATLLSPLDEAVISALEKVMMSDIKKVYVGIHSTFFNGIWNSIEGVSLVEFPDSLLNGSNIDSSDRKCATLEAGSLITVDCTEMYPYVCYKFNSDEQKLTECGTVDKDYVMDNRTGNCYKFHREPLQWRKAFGTCASEGTYLAIINSETEAMVFQELFFNDCDPIGTCEDNYYVNVGFVDWEENREWFTIHGDKLENSGYFVWGENQPDRMEKYEHCGSMHKDGTVHDMGCWEKRPFICEKYVDKLGEQNNRHDSSGLYY